MSRFLSSISKFDWLLLLAALILVAFGMSAIYSVALSTQQGDLGFIEKQAIALVLSVTIGGFFALSHYRLWRNWTLVFYLVSLILLLGVFFFGETIRGTTGWYSVFGFSFQPVEFAKIALIFVLAKYFSEKARRQFGWRELVGSGVLTLVPTVFVLLQPDLGSACVLLALWIILAFFAGLRSRQAVVLGVLAGIIGLFEWFIGFDEYQRERILIFLDPARDPLGHGYNVTQAIIAIGSGEWFGRGLGFGSQSQLRFLPESQTDFIISVIAEELGFVGLLFVFAAFGLLFYRLFKLVKLCRDDYTSYLLLGILGVFFVQMVVNVGMNLGLLPVTGIGLPLVSYGGSSLMMAFGLLGLAESVAVRTSSSG